MFIGHYGPAYAIKRWHPGIPIVALCIAGHRAEVAWATLFALGGEKTRVVPGIAASNPIATPNDTALTAFTSSFPVAAVAAWFGRHRDPGSRP